MENDYSNDNQRSLAEEKLKLEIEKIKTETNKTILEVEKLKRKWYKEPTLIIQSIGIAFSILTPIFLVFIGYFFLGGSLLLEAKKESLSYQERVLNERVEQIKRDTMLLVKSRDLLANEIKAKTNEIESLGNENSKLKTQGVIYSNEIHKQKEQIANQKNLLNENEKEKKLNHLYASLETMDSLGWNYNPNSQPIFFALLCKRVNELDETELNETYKKYTNDKSKILSCKLCFLIAMYNRRRSDVYVETAIRLIQEQGQGLFSEDVFRLESIRNIITNKIFSNTDFHSIVISLIKLSNQSRLKQQQFMSVLSIFNETRKDTLFIMNEKSKSDVLEYLLLCRNFFESIESSDFLFFKALPVIEQTFFPKKVLQVYLAQTIRRVGKIPSFYFPNPAIISWAEFLNLGSNIVPMMDSKYWDDRDLTYPELKSHLLEKKFSTYKNVKLALIADFRM